MAVTLPLLLTQRLLLLKPAQEILGLRANTRWHPQNSEEPTKQMSINFIAASSEWCICPREDASAQDRETLDESQMGNLKRGLGPKLHYLCAQLLTRRDGMQSRCCCHCPPWLWVVVGGAWRDGEAGMRARKTWVES